MKHLVSILLALMLGLAAAPLYGQDRVVADGVESFERWTPRNSEELRTLELAATQVVQDVRQTVVAIRIPQPGNGYISGSGTLISAKGLIVTAAHVVSEKDKKCLVYLADGSRYEGISLGLSHSYDLALVQITDPVDNLPHARMGYSSKVGVGQWVVSMGHPLGLIIEPLRPPVIRTSRVREMYRTKMVVDGSFAPGDSGGPTFNLRGELIGVNVSIEIGNSKVNNCAPIDNMRYNLQRFLAGEVFNETQTKWDADFGKKLSDAYKLAGQEKWEESRIKFQEAIEMDGARPEGYYHMACLMFRWYGAIGDRGDDPDPALLDEGLDNFEKAALLGFDDLKHILSDPDVNGVRTNSRFRQALRIIQRRMDFPAYLGVRVNQEEDKLIVTKVTINSPADVAGILVGDQIVQLEDDTLHELAQLRDAVATYRAGDFVQMTLSRGGVSQVVTIQMAARGDILDALPDDKLRGGQLMVDLWESKSRKYGLAMVSFMFKDKLLGYGPIVRSDGYILGKYSEIGDKEELHVRLPDGSLHEANIVAYIQVADLALIKIEASELPVIHFENVELSDGALAAVMATGSKPFAAGSISVKDFYDLRNEQRAFFGVAGHSASQEVLDELGVEGGVSVVGFHRASPAARQGLKSGDIIVELDGVAISNMKQILDIVRDSTPNESVLKLVVYRDKEKKELAIKVGAHMWGQGWGNSMHYLMIRGPFNTRCAGFGQVIHHDVVIGPSETGSLLLDSSGRVVGINIARYDRSKTLAIPSGRVAAMLAAMFEALEEDSGDDGPF